MELATGPILEWILFPVGGFYEQGNAATGSTRAQMYLWGKQLHVAQEGFCPTILLIASKFLNKHLASDNAEIRPTVHGKLIWYTWRIKTDSLQKNGKILNSYTKFRLTLRTRRSQWSRGLRRRSSTARLLRLWVRIPPGAWMFVCLSGVSVVCCQVEVSATGWSHARRDSTDCGAS